MNEGILFRKLVKECFAEALGTFILVFFGVGVVHAAVLTGAQSGLWQVAIVWGVGVALAIYCIQPGKPNPTHRYNSVMA